MSGHGDRFDNPNCEDHIPPFSDQEREAIDRNFRQIHRCCANLVTHWVDIGNALNEVWKVYEDNGLSQEYEKVVRDKFRFGKTTEGNLRRTARIMGEHPNKLDSVPDSLLVEIGWNKLQRVLFAEESMVKKDKGHLKQVSYLEDGVYMRFTHVDTEYELSATTCRVLDRLLSGKGPDGGKGQASQSKSSGEADKTEKNASDSESKDARITELNRKCTELACRVVELEEELAKKDCELKEKDERIEILKRELDAQDAEDSADVSDVPDPTDVIDVVAHIADTGLAESTDVIDLANATDDADEFTRHKQARSLVQAEETANKQREAK